ncbi:MAG: DUF4259 domain-containing protein [Sphingomonadaceae bacterium]|nr:DUF4259 domain-containing protein [Sphingomonadaceae bacterium]MCP5384844.1 DUF4259 domain-containing protein [Altererythrobacter sp.]MCP5390160.1 DUF4259 domain-containing protein [Sphingomonadaceae bacterium]MCP5392507.1 DUF4259 domain-containing protein [Sphingomonadaceae bacterium]
MGTWGSGSFENDAALDYVAEIQSVADLDAALTVAGSGEAVDADESCRVIVAAECIAAMRGHASPDLPDNLAGRLAGFGKPSMALFNAVRDNLSAVMSKSELLDLWSESGEMPGFARALTELMERLNKPQRKPAKARKKEPQPNPSPCMFCDQPMGDGAFHMLDVIIHEDDISTSKRGGWAHLQCLNAALHPKHMIQNWEFDDELLEWISRKMDEERSAS